MNINNIFQRLEAGINECEAGAERADAERHSLRGMAKGFRLAMRIMLDNGVVPVADSPSGENHPDVIPFVLPDQQDV